MDYLEHYFDDPKKFSACLVEDFETNKEEVTTLRHNKLTRMHHDAFATAMHRHSSELKSIPDDKLGSMMTTFVISGILSLLPRYDDTDMIAEVAGDAHKAIDEHGRAHFGEQTNRGHSR